MWTKFDKFVIYESKSVDKHTIVYYWKLPTPEEILFHWKSS